MPVHRQQTEDDDMVWPPDDLTGEWVVENGRLMTWHSIPGFDGSSPGVGDQWNPFGCRGRTGNRDYRAWFENRVPKTVEGAKKDLQERIKTKVCAQQGTSPTTIPGLVGGKDDIDVAPSMGRYGDSAQDFWERHVKLGFFEFKAEKVSIKWKPNCCFDYSATIYVEEQTGADAPWADGGEDCWEDPLWFTGLFVKRNLRMAEWPVSGTYCCPNGGKK